MPCVYVFTNPANPGLVKIGYTKKTAAVRAAELSSATGVAAPFVVAWFRDTPTVDAAARLENLVHQALRKDRTNHSREFFKITVDKACEVIEEIGNAKNLITGWRGHIQEIIYDDDEVAKEEKEATKHSVDLMSARMEKINSVEQGVAYLADPANEIWVGKWFFDNGEEIQQIIRGHKNMSAWLASFGEIQDGKIVARSYIYHRDILIRTSKISYELACQVRKNQYEAQTRLMRGLVSASKKPITVERGVISAFLDLATRWLGGRSA